MKERSSNQLSKIHLIASRFFNESESTEYKDLLSSYAYKVSASLRDGLLDPDFTGELDKFISRAQDFFKLNLDYDYRSQVVEFLSQIAQYLQAEKIFVKHRSDKSRDFKSSTTSLLDQVILRLNDITKELKDSDPVSLGAVDLERHDLKGDTKILERYEELKSRNLFEDSLLKLALDFQQSPDLFADKKNVSLKISSDAEIDEYHRHSVLTLFEHPILISLVYGKDSFSEITKYRSEILEQIFSRVEEVEEDELKTIIKDYFDKKLSNMPEDTTSKDYAVQKLGILLRCAILLEFIEKQSSKDVFFDEVKKSLEAHFGHHISREIVSTQYAISIKAIESSDDEEFATSSKTLRDKLMEYSEGYKREQEIISMNTALRLSKTSLEGEIETKESELQKSKALIQAMQQQAVEREWQMQAKEQQIQEMQQQVVEREQQMQARERQIQAMQQQTDEMEELINGIHFQVGEREQQEFEMEYIIQRINSEVDKSEGQMQTIQRQAVERERQIQAMQQQAVERERQIQAMQQQADEMEQQMQEMQQQMQEMEQQMQEREQQMQEREEGMQLQLKINNEQMQAMQDQMKIFQEKMQTIEYQMQEKLPTKDTVRKEDEISVEESIIGDRSLRVLDPKSDQKNSYWTTLTSFTSFLPGIPSASNIFRSESSKSPQRLKDDSCSQKVK